MNELHTIYLYSTSTLKEATVGINTGKQRPPRGKVGQTIHENATIRVEQQDTTSTAEPLQLLASRQVPTWITDKMVRDVLVSFGYVLSRVDADREWIDFINLTNDIEMIKNWNEAINQILHGVRAPYDFANFDYQNNIINWVVNKFKQGTKDVLVNAIMRAGKCKISYDISKAVNAKTVLVITAKPGVDDSWAELLQGGEKPHISYTGWKYHSYKNYKKKALVLNNDVNVVFVSLQYINKHIDIPSKLLQSIFDTKWDIIFFDEQHYATQTDNTLEVFKRIKFSYKVELSGTPYKTLLSGRYDKENIINFDYIDEQNIRSNAAPGSALAKAFEYRADINWALINIPDSVKRLINEDGFTHTKLFATSKDGKFINLQAVIEYLRYVKANAYKNSPIKDKDINKHTIWVLPDDVKAINALVSLLKEDAYFKKYAIINASGKGVKNISTVKEIINNVENGKLEQDGTITITCGRFLEGTTVPGWCAVHQMNDDKSAADYFQGCFRIKSEWRKGNKHSVIVFDYSPQRFIGVSYKHVIDTADHDNRETNEERFRSWLAVSDVYDYADNKWNILDAKTIIQRANEDMSFHSDAFGEILPDKSVIDETLIKLLLPVKAASNTSKAKTVLNDNGIETGSNFVSETSSKEKKTEIEKNDLKKAVLKIKQVLKSIPALIYNTEFEPNKINSVKHIINYPDKNFIEIHTGLTPDTLKLVFNTFNSLQYEKINRRIDALTHSNIFK